MSPSLIILVLLSGSAVRAQTSVSAGVSARPSVPAISPISGAATSPLSLPAPALPGASSLTPTLLAPAPSPSLLSPARLATAEIPVPAAAAEAKREAAVVAVAAKPGAPAASARAVLTSAAAHSAASKADGPSVPVESAKSVADASFDGAAVRPAAEPVPASLSASAPLPAASAAEPPASANVPAPAPNRSPRRFVWPALVGVVWTTWAIGMTTLGHWGLFAQNWFMSVTMAFGSFVAGATSEGSGSVSFPVMTLLFHIPPAVARDFSLMIQSVGMTTAALTIFATKIPVEKRVLLWGMLGGAVGMALGATFVAPLFAPPFAKMFFTSLWAAFAISHFMASRRRGEAVQTLGPLGRKDVLGMLAFGVAGGVVSSIVGTGLCMVMFTLLTLGYRLSEKVATPTSVILMASNALFGFLWKGAVLGGMAPMAWNYWWVCVPIVVVGAPLGARFIAGRSRKFVTGILYAAISIQLIAAFVIVPQTPVLLATSAFTFLTGAAIFRAMARRGDKAAEAAK